MCNMRINHNGKCILIPMPDICVEGMTSLREFASWGEVSHLRLCMRMAKIAVLSDEVEIVITQAVISFFTPGFPGCEREANPTL